MAATVVAAPKIHIATVKKAKSAEDLDTEVAYDRVRDWRWQAMAMAAMTA